MMNPRHERLTVKVDTMIRETFSPVEKMKTPSNWTIGVNRDRPYVIGRVRVYRHSPLYNPDVLTITVNVRHMGERNWFEVPTLEEEWEGTIAAAFIWLTRQMDLFGVDWDVPSRVEAQR